MASRRGRPPSTTREEVARVALELFARDGFERTTTERIASAIGVHRRTLHRYFDSKNDIVWGDFESVLARLRDELAAEPVDASMIEALGRAVVRSNRYPPEMLEELRIRITLITTVPSLQAHSMLRYAAWRSVVAEFAAERLGMRPDELVPIAVGHAALGASMAAFEHWAHNADADLEANLVRAYALLRDRFAVAPEEAR